MAAGCVYDGAPLWVPGSSPPPGAGLLPGTAALGDYFVEAYGGHFDGFAWRPNTGDPRFLSIHGTGRAGDAWSTPAAMHAFALECVQMHKEWGIQLVIHDGDDWQCDEGWTDYGGPCPHKAHDHVELTEEAARTNTIDTYRTGGFSMADIRDLLDAEQDTRRLFLEVAGKLLRQNGRILRAEFTTRQRLEDAGVIPDPKDDDRKEKAALETAATEAEDDAKAIEEALLRHDDDARKRRAALKRRDGD